MEKGNNGNNNNYYILSRQRSMPAIQTNMRKTIRPVYPTPQVTTLFMQPKPTLSQFSSGRKPMQIYKPPNRREMNKDTKTALVYYGDDPHEGQITTAIKLNVNAKEFVINNPSSTSVSSRNIKKNEYGKSKGDDFNYALTGSKSQGCIFNSNNNNNRSKSKPTNYSIERARSNTTIQDNHKLTNNNKVQFKILEKNSNHNKESTDRINLKRSTSMNAADFKSSNDVSGDIFSQLELFPTNLRNGIKTAIIGIERKDSDLIDLAEKIVDFATMNKTHGEITAKVSVLIIKGDRKYAYIDALINICHLFLQKKDKKLRTNTNAFPAFFTFLYELYVQLKRTQLFSTLPEYQVLLLTLIGRCCEECLLPKNNVRNVDEMESLFAVLMKVGNELEVMLPDLHNRIYLMLRNVILLNNDTEQIKKTALQLIEIRAAKYRLPSSALSYYYPK